MQSTEGFNWTGLNAGGAWGKTDADATAGCPDDFDAAWVCTTAIPESGRNLPVLDGAGSGTLRSNGFAGGVEAGANLQSGNIVYGVEVDYGALNLSASRSASALMPFGNFGGLPVTIGSSVETDWLLTARGRIGWAEQNLLIYATGGLALTRLKVSNFYRDFVTGSESASSDELKAGLTGGGGAEYALDDHWTIKGEYLFVYFDDASVSGNIGSSNPLGTGAANPLGVSEDLRVHLLRAGINYLF